MVNRSLREELLEKDSIISELEQQLLALQLQMETTDVVFEESHAFDEDDAFLAMAHRGSQANF